MSGWKAGGTIKGSAYGTPPAVSGATFGMNIVGGQGWPSTVTATWQSLTTGGGAPFPSGTGKHGKFYSGANGGFMASITGVGYLSNLLTAGYGSFGNESPIGPCIWSNQYTAADALSAMTWMNTNYPSIIYYLGIQQEWDSAMKGGETWPSGSLHSGALTIANIQDSYANLINVRSANPSVSGNCKIVICSTGYAELDAPVAGISNTNMASGFPTGLDLFMIDDYQQVGTQKQGKAQNWTAEYRFPNWTSAAALFGTQWCLGETGVTLAYPKGVDTGDTDAAMAVRLQGIVDYVSSDSTCLWASYWMDRNYHGLWENLCTGNSGVVNPNMASVPLTLAVWQNAIAASS